MSLKTKLIDSFFGQRITFLGAGPMSKRVTDAIIDLANSYKRPIAMIPSRRQVDAEHLGGGYVNNWSTEKFTQYVRSRDKGSFVLLSRDHSGPWQLTKEKDGVSITHTDAMREVKESLEVDIQVGFDLIHIDPSQGLAMGRKQSEVEDDALELLEFCQSRDGGRIDYEIGADEQSQIPDYVQTAEDSLLRIMTRAQKLGLRLPVFYVLQTGTKVMELRNIGSFDASLPVEGMLPSAVQLPEILRMCKKHGVFLKEHNADYLSNEALKWHPRYGVHAANVAPEFGVTETRALISAAKTLGASDFLDLFGDLVITGGKWKKWLIEGSKANDEDKIIIAGHYHFSDPQLSDALLVLQQLARKKSFELDNYLFSAVTSSINRYLIAFGYRKVAN
jgi:hypothetical protein